MNTAERLGAYYGFDDHVLATAERVAETQAGMTWQEFLTSCNIQQAPQKYLVERGSTEFIEFRPTGDYDEKRARVFHGAMGTPLDPNTAYMAATVFAFDPTTRLFAFANPSGPNRDAGLLGAVERKKVAVGDLRPTVEPALRLLARTGIESATHLGISYGAEKAFVAAAYAARFDQAVRQITVIEPPAVTDRTRLQLGTAFAKTNEHLADYVAASATPAFEAARRQSVGITEYSLGLLRFTNLAIAKGLTHGLLKQRAESALSAQPEVHATLVWGSESELALDGLMQKITTCLQGQFNTEHERLSAIRLPGQYHALMNDIHLQAALALQAERSAVNS